MGITIEGTPVALASESSPEESFPVSASGHLLLIFEDDSGREFVIRGGPQFDNPSNRGVLVLEKSVLIAESLDRRVIKNDNGNIISVTPESRGNRQIPLGDRESDDVWNLITQHAANIDEQRFPYSPLGDNSNGTVGNLLHLVGINVDDVLPDPDGIMFFPFSGLNKEFAFDYSITGTNENDIIKGRGGDQIFLGGEGDDELQGGTGNDSLDGGLGNDTFIGGVGNDELQGGVGEDSYVFQVSGDGEDTIIDSDGMGKIVLTNGSEQSLQEILGIAELSGEDNQGRQLYEIKDNGFKLAFNPPTRELVIYDWPGNSGNDRIRIQDFENGDLGLKLIRAENILLLIDRSSSMLSSVEALKGAATEIAEAALEANDDLSENQTRVAVASFGEWELFAYLQQDFTTDENAVVTGINDVFNDLELEHGTNLNPLMNILLSNRYGDLTNWQVSAEMPGRIVIVSDEAPSPIFEALDTQLISEDLNIFAVVVGEDEDAEYSLEGITALTQGEMFQAADASEVVEATVQAIKAFPGASDDEEKPPEEDRQESGSSADEDLIGRSGDDDLSGGAGDDGIAGGAGNDVLVGDYNYSQPATVEIGTSGTAVDGVGPQYEVSLDGQQIQIVDVTAGGQQRNQFEMMLMPDSQLEIRFLNDLATPEEDRNLSVHSVQVNGTVFNLEGGFYTRGLPDATPIAGRTRLSWNGTFALDFAREEVSGNFFSHGDDDLSGGAGDDVLIGDSFGASAVSQPIYIKTKGTAFDGEFAKFRVLVDEQLIGEATTTSQSQTFVFETSLLTARSTLDIVFLNDAANDQEDRNLIVEAVHIGNDQVPLSIEDASYYVANSVLEGRMRLSWSGKLSFESLGYLHDVPQSIAPRFGSDFLTGGAGADTFVYERGHGFDYITDFEDDIDTLELITHDMDFIITGNDSSRVEFADNSSIFIQNITPEQLADDLFYV